MFRPLQILHRLGAVDRLRATGHRTVPHRAAPSDIEDPSPVSVQTGLVQSDVAAESDDHALIRASSFIVSLTGSPLPFVGTRFDHVHNPPHFTSLTEPVVEIVFSAQETKIRQILHNGPDCNALENVDAAMAVRAQHI